jgi:hypothetical protein
MAKVVFVCENCEASDEIDLVALASYGFRLQCPKCSKEYIYKPFDDAGEKSAKEVTEMWQASLTKFTSTMIDMIYWDKKPLEDAIAARERLQKENSLLKVKLLELESQLTQREADLLKARQFLPADEKQSKSESPA